MHHGHGNVFAAIATPVYHHRWLPWRGLTCRVQPKFLHAVAPERATEETGGGAEQGSPPSVQVTWALDNLPVMTTLAVLLGRKRIGVIFSDP